MEEIKVNDYIRTPNGEIGVVTCTELLGPEIFTGTKYLVLAPEGIKTHSKNIIDLIEVGDYVNGYQVTYVCNKEPCPSGKCVDIDCDKPSEYCTLWEAEIKSIVTHEQFEAMKYKVEDD